VATYASITRLEYAINLIMLSISIYCIQKTRMTSYSYGALIGPQSSHSVSSSAGNGIPTSKGHHHHHPVTATNYNYCKKCMKTIPGRDHHCIWLNTCIGKSNRYWFVATVFFSGVWLLVTVLVNLTSICYPVYLFGVNGAGTENGLNSRWFLVPFQCPDVYHSYTTV
jgi:hypothetical protein